MAPPFALRHLWYTSNGVKPVKSAMSLPIPTNSRTFLRNIKPLNYPDGTRQGVEWATPGGQYDNTDPRKPIYWGPPMIVNNDPDFGLLPGETPANCVRRLKIDGYIGLYTNAPRVKKAEEKPEPPRPSLLAQLSRLAEQKKHRNGSLSVIRAQEEGRRPNNFERRTEARRVTHAALLEGEGRPVPPMVGHGLGEEQTEEEQRLLGLLDDPTHEDEEEEENPLPTPPAEKFLPIQPVESVAFTPVVILPVVAPIESLNEQEEELPEEDDSPVGGGGKVAQGIPEDEEDAPPVVVKPSRPSLAGRGRRGRPPKNP